MANPFGIAYLKTLTVADFKVYYPKDFNNEYYLDSSGGNAIDSYIGNAMTEAINEINVNLFSNNAVLQIAFMRLSAHYLVQNLRNSDIGIQSLGQNIQAENRAKDLEAKFGIPRSFLDDIVLNGYTRTNYGLMYLAQIMPLLRGNMVHISGTTLP